MNTQRRHPNVVHVSELEEERDFTGTKFGFAVKELSDATDARGIGCSWYEVPPGRSAFPLHYHCANEEALYVLEGHGDLQFGTDHVALRPGDYVTFPVGPEAAHKLTNTGTTPLRYLCMATMIPTEVVGYPDSGKIGARGAKARGDGTETVWVRHRTFQSAAVEYFAGEDTGEVVTEK